MRLDTSGLHVGRFSASAGALFAAALLLYTGGTLVLRLCLLAATLHELGHLLMCWLLAVPVCGFRLTLLGAVLELDGRCQSGGEECLVALAGPLANLLTGLAVLRIPIDYEMRCLFAGASVMLALFNLLPVQPLDGSRVLHGAVSFGGLERADRVTAVVSHLAGLFLFIPGICFAIQGSVSLLFIVLWLAAAERKRC